MATVVTYCGSYQHTPLGNRRYHLAQRPSGIVVKILHAVYAQFPRNPHVVAYEKTIGGIFYRISHIVRHLCVRLCSTSHEAGPYAISPFHRERVELPVQFADADGLGVKNIHFDLQEAANSMTTTEGRFDHFPMSEGADSGSISRRYHMSLSAYDTLICA